MAIPPYIAFWGIDSGQRHSVGGADYGTVRAAAFMGLQLLAVRRSSEAAEARSSSGGGEANGHAAAAHAAPGECTTRLGAVICFCMACKFY